MAKTLRALLLAVAIVTNAGVSAAQEFSHVLQDGRVISVAPESPPCGAPVQRPDPQFAFLLMFSCEDSIGEASGEGLLYVLREPDETASRDYLLQTAAVYWPHLPEEERASQIYNATATLADGAQAEFLCLIVGNGDETFGESTCVMDLPRVQVVTFTQAADMEQAAGTFVMLLTGIAIR